MWVFGYGSLIWKVDFPYEKKIIGYIKGYVRRFYQKSTDHRGVPEKVRSKSKLLLFYFFIQIMLIFQPGRVATLLASDKSDDQVWGVAYKIASHNIDNVVNHLDYREKNGYTKQLVLFYPYVDTSTEKPFYLTIYIADENNPSYAGAEDLNEIAQHVLLCHGPSGSNKEYLYNLAESMRELVPTIDDQHLFELERIVKNLENKSS